MIQKRTVYSPPHALRFKSPCGRTYASSFRPRVRGSINVQTNMREFWSLYWRKKERRGIIDNILLRYSWRNACTFSVRNAILSFQVMHLYFYAFRFAKQRIVLIMVRHSHVTCMVPKIKSSCVLVESSHTCSMKSDRESHKTTVCCESFLLERNGARKLVHGRFPVLPLKLRELSLRSRK